VIFQNKKLFILLSVSQLNKKVDATGIAARKPSRERITKMSQTDW